MIWLTFFVVFLLVLGVTLTYMLRYNDYVAAGRALFDVSVPLHADTNRLSRLILALRVEHPYRALFWAFTSALMQMFAVLAALVAWNLSASDLVSVENRQGSSMARVDAGITGFVFGFVGGVLLFYLMDLAFASIPALRGGNPLPGGVLLKVSWPWAVLGGITGLFLLIQAVHVRQNQHSAANVTALLQGLVSGLAGMIIAWMWGYDRVAEDTLAAFALLSGFNILVVGWALGVLARWIMLVDTLQPAASVENPAVLAAALPESTGAK